MSGGIFRLLGALANPLMVLYRWWRPVTDRASIAILSDELSAAVQRSEKRLQQELRAIAHEFMPVEFTTTARRSRGAGPVKVKHIATFLEQLGHPDLHRQRVVVLGAPGSGKTVAATYLVLGLLKTRQELDDSPRANEPVPVRINAAGWDGQQDFTRWLIVRLGYDYQVRPNVAREVVERGLILPVIDGLDEMDTDSAGTRACALLDRLNRAPWRGRPVIVMCRTTEFTELTRQRGDNGLHGGTTLTLQPLAVGTVTEYLKAQRGETSPSGPGHPGWTQVITHITDHPDGTLATCVHNPWMLGLTASTLGRTPHIAEQLISCSTETAVRDLLFAAQIPAAVAATDEGDETYRDYTAANVEKWMRSLAVCLQRRRDGGRNGTAIRLDEIWEIAGTHRIRILHALILAVIFGAAVGVGSGVVFVAMVGVGAGVVFGAIVGVAVGLIRFPLPQRMVWNAPGPSRWRRGIKAGALAGSLVGVVFGAAAMVVLVVEDVIGTAIEVGLNVGDAVGEDRLHLVVFDALILAGVAFVILIGVVTGVVVGLQVDPNQELALVTDERRIIHDNIQATAGMTVVVWLVSGMAGGLGFGLLGGFEDTRINVAIVTTYLLIPGSAVGAMTGAVAGLAAERFGLATLVFRFTKVMPSHPAVFLDWARRSGLLRVNGTAYQFRHDTYQQWIQQPRSSVPGQSLLTGHNEQVEEPVS